MLLGVAFYNFTKTFFQTLWNLYTPPTLKSTHLQVYIAFYTIYIALYTITKQLQSNNKAI